MPEENEDYLSRMLKASKPVRTGLTYNPDYAKSIGITEEMFNSYNPDEQLGVVNSASGLVAADSDTLGDVFAKYKTGIGAGIGLGQLGLGLLNYNLNKKGLESGLATAAQKRDLLAKAQVNRENIASKARSALRFG